MIVVDYQKDFVTGSLGSSYAKAIEPALMKKIKKYHANFNEVVFTIDTHQKNYLETQEGKALPIPHCIQNEEGWQLTDRIENLRRPNDRTFLKNSFGSGALFDFLRQTPYEQIELCGITSNICVLSNAILAKTAQPETPIIIDATCVASNDPLLHKKALAVLESLQFTVVNRPNKTSQLKRKDASND